MRKGRCIPTRPPHGAADLRLRGTDGNACERLSSTAFMGFVFDISVAVACLTGPLCALTSLTIPLVVRTAGEDVKGSVGDRRVAGGEGCPMARSIASESLARSCMRGNHVYASVSAPHGESFGWGHPRCINSLWPCRASRSEDVHKCKVRLCASYPEC